MRRGIVGFVFVLLFMSFASAGFFGDVWGKITGEVVLNNNCIDSETGRNYFEKGIIFHYDEGEVPDLCLNDKILEEYSCDDTFIRTESYDCPNGCVDGACVEEEIICIDSDEGKNIYMMGEANGKYGTKRDFCANPEESQEGQSICLDDGCGVWEHYCNVGQVDNNYVYADFINCPNGCENGACINEITYCSEANYFCIPSAECSVGEDVGNSYYCPSLSDTCCTAENLRLCSELGGDVCSSNEVCTGNSRKAIDTDFCCTGLCEERPQETEEIICTDSDGGLDYYNKGVTIGCNGNGIDACDEIISTEDRCLDDYSDGFSDYGAEIYEQYCYNDGKGVMTEKYNCSNGCQDGACLAEGTEIITPTEEEVIEIPEDGDNYVCRGCELDNKCYPISYRTSIDYCSPDGEFISQLSAEELCNNNFECGSNLCIDSECLEAGFFRKIVSWFKNLFG